MGLETTTYVAGLTPAWPLAGDNKSQGDDHLRLIKATLQSTFPNASKPFYFPTAEVVTGAIVLDATDNQNTIIVDSTAGNIAVTLPGGFTTTEKGWFCDVVKVSADTNAAIVAAASGNIISKSGTTATIRVGIYSEPARFFWSGSFWLCFKHGPAVGSTENYDGNSVPYGYLLSDGSAYSNTAFAELFAALGTSTLRDKRGRFEIGDGTGSGLTARVSGTLYGAETHLLTAAQIPSITSAGTLADHQHAYTSPGGTSGMSAAGGPLNATTSVIGASTGNPISPPTQNVSSTNTGGQAHPIMPPSIGVKKIIRAC